MEEGGRERERERGSEGVEGGREGGREEDEACACGAETPKTKS